MPSSERLGWQSAAHGASKDEHVGAWRTNVESVAEKGRTYRDHNRQRDAGEHRGPSANTKTDEKAKRERDNGQQDGSVVIRPIAAIK